MLLLICLILRLQEERNANYTMSKMLSLLSGLGYMYNLRRVPNDTMLLTHLHRALGKYNMQTLLRDVCT